MKKGRGVAVRQRPSQFLLQKGAAVRQCPSQLVISPSLPLPLSPKAREGSI